MTVLVDEQKLVDQFSDLARKVRIMVRAETIEECAKVAESAYGDKDDIRARGCGNYIATAIRSLRGDSDV